VFADLVDMSKYSRQNNGCKWILLIIDTFSRKCFAITLSDKTGPKVLWAFKAYINELNQGNKPLELITDSGSEFISTDFKNFVKDNQIYHHIVEPAYHKTLGMIDQLCKHIKQKIFGYMYANDTTEWLPVFDSIVRTYNATPHSSIGYLTPDDVYDGDHLIKQYIRYLQNKKKKQNKRSY
jgi:transposase InsO family protein